MDTNNDQLIYLITKSDFHLEAKRIFSRELDEREILLAKKHLEFGIGEGLGMIYNTIFTEVLQR